MGFGFSPSLGLWVPSPERDVLLDIVDRHKATAFIFDTANPGVKAHGFFRQYETSLGKTAADASSDPAGLYLDRSERLALGTELITNGTFDSDVSGWTVGSNLSAVANNGRAEITRSGSISSSAAFEQAITVTSGRWYRVEFEISNASAAFNPQNSSGSTEVVGTGSFSRILRATSSSMELNFWPTNDATTIHLDNVTAKELPGNHAFQDTAASRPTVVESGGIWHHAFDGSADHWKTGLVPASEMTIAACFHTSSAAVPIGSSPGGGDRCYLYAGAEAGAGWLDQTQTTIKISEESRNADIVLLLRVNASVVKLHKNGVEGYSAAPSGTLSSPIAMYIGALNSGGTASTYVNGRIYRACAIQAYLTDSEARAVQQTLAAGIVSI